MFCVFMSWNALEFETIILVEVTTFEKLNDDETKFHYGLWKINNLKINLIFRKLQIIKRKMKNYC